MRTPATLLKLAIVHDGRSQREIAAEAGIHEATLSRIVRGMHCEEATREKITRVLGRKVSDCFDIDDVVDAESAA